MTHVFNDPAVFTEESLEGLVSVHGGLLRRVVGGVVSRASRADGRVAVVVGGGSGHYPMFAGLVGQGLADGAVVGNIFTSPSAQYAYSVAKRADRGAGVVFCYGNYAGDVMNFGIAVERLRAEGIPAASVIVTDDVLSAPPDEAAKRRGLAGDFVVLRALAGAAAAGKPFADVVAAGERANRATRTVGVAFDGCTFPGADHRLFDVPPGVMSIGLGVHGEPGLEDIAAVPSRALARLLLGHLLGDEPDGVGGRVAVIVNGLGATKAEELFVLWRDLVPLLAEAGLEPVEPEVGEIITSLDMAGLSLTLSRLDAELEEYWTAPAYGPGYRKGAVGVIAGQGGDEEVDASHTIQVPPATPASREVAAHATAGFTAALEEIRSAEGLLADTDAVAGDGDHGRGMVRGLEAAAGAARAAHSAGAGLGTTIARAGEAWAEHAGGTSGVLWGAALRAFGARLGDEVVPVTADIVAAAEDFAAAVRSLGRVQLGDKTMLDAIDPAVRALATADLEGLPLPVAVHRAAEAADAAARDTARLTPKVGRARPLAERSLGHPDPGAMSFAMIVRRLAGAQG